MWPNHCSSHPRFPCDPPRRRRRARRDVPHDPLSPRRATKRRPFQSAPAYDALTRGEVAPNADPVAPVSRGAASCPAIPQAAARTPGSTCGRVHVVPVNWGLRSSCDHPQPTAILQLSSDAPARSKRDDGKFHDPSGSCESSLRKRGGCELRVWVGARAEQARQECWLGDCFPAA